MLDVEVTENPLVTDVDEAADILAAPKQAGLSTSLDDFGSGYSSLAYLVRLPIDTLKIDKSFVWALGNAPKRRSIKKAGRQMARSSCCSDQLTSAHQNFTRSPLTTPT